MAPAVPKGWGETKLGSWSPVAETSADTALLNLLFSRTQLLPYSLPVFSLLLIIK